MTDITKAERGSQKWLQLLVNEHSDVAASLLAKELQFDDGAAIEWVSPLAENGYREYSDSLFLDRLGVELPLRPLIEFWPRGGPVWDGLGRTDRGDILLVEAKAHIPEMRTSASAAVSGESITLIAASLNETRNFLGGSSYVDWTQVFYQYTNRLAHLYLLRELNRIPAWLIFFYFVGDGDVNGPESADEWKGATALLHAVLGLRQNHPLSRWVRHIHVQCDSLR